MTGVDVLKRFDQRQLWRFFVDGRFHKKYNGWTGYERQESGSTQGMINAYRLALENFDLSGGISCHYIRKLHHTCMFNVHSTLSESAPGDLRCEETGFKFFAARTTMEFLKELFELRSDDATKLFHTPGVDKPASELNIIDVYQRLIKRKRLQFNPWYPSLDETTKLHFEQRGSFSEYYEAKAFIQMQFAMKMEVIVDDFNRRMPSLKGEDQIVEAIAAFIQEIELLHPFPDGNCRTLLTLTNHLLMHYGLHPTIVENPNLDGTFSRKEYAYEIKKGMRCTQQLLDDPEAELYGYSIKSASDTEISQFKTMSQDLVAAINNFDQRQFAYHPDHIYLTPDILADITGGEWIHYDRNIRFKRVGSHSDIGKGYLCFCVSLEDWRKQGISTREIIERLRQCVQKGVGALVVDRREYAVALDIPALLVSNVNAELSNVAVRVRKAVNPKTVFVGGTVGKTGLKLQLHCCLSHLASTHAILNTGNIKVPILYSLASLKQGDQVEIVEVSGAAPYSWGASRSRIIAPDICVFADISQVHMDIHGSVDNLITNKASAVEGLQRDGICIVNADARYGSQLIEKIRQIREDVQILTFGTEHGNTAHLLSRKFDPEQFGWKIAAVIDGTEIEYQLPLFQSHAPLQSLGVLLAVKMLGYDPREAVKNYHNFSMYQTMGRLFRITRDEKSFVFYDQSLRGSIQGMESAFKDIDNLEIAGRKIAVLGGTSIEEDGEFTASQHKQMSTLVNRSSLDLLYTTGPYLDYFHENMSEDMKSKLVMHSDDREQILRSLRHHIEDGDLVFVMGSAYLRMGDIGRGVLSMGQRTVLSGQ